MKKSILLLSIAIASFCGDGVAAVLNQSILIPGITIKKIVALTLNGNRYPSGDAICNQQFGDYIGKSYSPAFPSLHFNHLQSIKLCDAGGNCSVLQNVSVENHYSFFARDFEGADRVFYSFQADKNQISDQRLGIFFNYPAPCNATTCTHKIMQCALTAGKMPKS